MPELRQPHSFLTQRPRVRQHQTRQTQTKTPAGSVSYRDTGSLSELSESGYQSPDVATNRIAPCLLSVRAWKMEAGIARWTPGLRRGDVQEVLPAKTRVWMVRHQTLFTIPDSRTVLVLRW